MKNWSCGRLLHDAGLPVAFGQGKSGTGWMKMAKLQFATSAEHLVAAPGATKVKKLKVDMRPPDARTATTTGSRARSRTRPGS